MFCPKCKALLVLNRATGQKECKRPNCGHSEDKGKEVITKRKQEDPVEKLSTLISQSSFRFNKGINTFFDGVAKNMESLLGPSKDAQKKSDHKK